MVVAQIVRVRNNTLRTFRLVAGDPFYTPRIDGQPCGSGEITLPPGFDQETDGLVIPWESCTRIGLEIRAEDSEELVRCIVGPQHGSADNTGSDWLQLRNALWEPLAPERWLPLGPRHILGTVGGAVDLLLTLRDARGEVSGPPAQLLDFVHFEQAVRCAPPNTVFLNVYDLAPSLSIPNAILCNTIFSTVGAFHAAVETYGEEWSFYRTPNPSSCGVCRSLRPRHHQVHVYRQSVNLGATCLKDWEVRYLVRRKLALKWPGGGYDLLMRNCIHFCDELLLSLGVRPVPAWVRGLHETGASVLRLPWPLSLLRGGGGGGGEAKRPALEDANDTEASGQGDLAQVESGSVGTSETGVTPRSSAAPSDFAQFVARSQSDRAGSLVDGGAQDMRLRRHPFFQGSAEPPHAR